MLGCRSHKIKPLFLLVVRLESWYSDLVTALLEKPLKRVSPLKAGRSSRIKAATNPVTYVDPSGLQCQKDPKLSKKYPELPGAIGAIMGLKGKPCSGGGYHFSASEVNSILGEVRGVLADSSFKIYAADKASGGGHSYAERVEGAIKVYNKTGDLMTNPGLSGNVSRTDVLSHVLLHELLHEVVNRHKKGADCPGPDPELELQTAEELKANHNFVISLLDCLLPGTRGLSQKPNMPMPGGGPV